MQDDSDPPPLATGTDHGAHLIRLIVNQDEAAHSWLKFFFTIESALAAAFLVVINMSDHIPRTPAWFGPAVGVVIPLLGVIFTRALMRIVLRQNQWQAWFIQKFNAMPGHAGAVFPEGIGRDAPVEFQPHGYVARIVRNLGRWIVFGWIVLGLLVIQAHFWADIKAWLPPLPWL